jgi:hypothetical protein
MEAFANASSLLLLLAALPTAFPDMMQDASHPASLVSSLDLPPRTPHDPIFIGNDTAFTPGNGVTRGSGTADDPYIVSGWSIEVQDNSDGISVQNAHVYFIIENNTVSHAHFPSAVGSAIALGVAGNHGYIRNNVLRYNGIGVDILESLATVENNLIERNYHDGFSGGGGVWISGSDPPLLWHGIRGNTFIDNRPWGVFHSYNVLQPSDALPIDASDNYWGSPLPPTVAIFFGNGVFPLGVPGSNYVTPTVLTAPWRLEGG